MLFSLHHAFMPHSLPDQKTQNEKVMNRNFPVLEYPETVNLKYLIRPSESLRVKRCIQQVQEMSLPLCDNPAYPAAACPGRNFGPAQVVNSPEACRLLPKATG